MSDTCGAIVCDGVLCDTLPVQDELGDRYYTKYPYDRGGVSSDTHNQENLNVLAQHHTTAPR